MNDVAETLDPLRLPLTGERLIEASAGTGKTFTIAALYLRLLLGLGGSAAFPRPLTVEELLVVTLRRPPLKSCVGEFAVISMSCASPVCEKARIIRCMPACWKKLATKSRPRSGYYWRNDKWMRPRFLPSTVFASVCSA